MKRVFLLLLVLFPFLLQAADEDLKTLRYVPRVREIPASTKAWNFGAVYAASWGFYYVSQKETIEKDGSWHNWQYNTFSPHFDNDSFDYNIFKHSMAGASYFLFYRAHGYDRGEAFMWSFLSSLAFEFTIETVTERPSFQDIYQTPVYGTILGIGLEKMSWYFHSQDNWWGHALGYVFNPFTAITRYHNKQKVSFMPMFDGKSAGAQVAYEF